MRQAERYSVLVNRRHAIAGLAAALASASQGPDYPFVCPMDPDVRSPAPAKCPRCGMALVAGVPDAREFVIDMKVSPRAFKPGTRLQLRFTIKDPDSGKPAKLQLFHEKLFHLFLVSGDLRYFAHEHPDPLPDGSFLFRTVLPESGEYRVLCDVYPEGAMPQMIARTLVVPGPAATAASAVPDLEIKTAENLQVGLRLDPLQPLAGKKTMLFFSLHPRDGLERYLGAWGHLLAASTDLIDLLHAHPAWEEQVADVQFNVIFPRPGIYRVWVQFQRLGTVNTVAFNVPVSEV
jgi:hypothetical protein